VFAGHVHAYERTVSSSVLSNSSAANDWFFFHTAMDFWEL
jgi:hypothetical protein